MNLHSGYFLAVALAKAWVGGAVALAFHLLSFGTKF